MRTSVMFRRFASIVLALAASVLAAQERTGVVRVQVSPAHADWTYHAGESVDFSVQVLRDGHPIQGASISYELGPEMLPPTEKKTVAVPPQGLTIKAAGLAMTESA